MEVTNEELNENLKDIVEARDNIAAETVARFEGLSKEDIDTYFDERAKNSEKKVCTPEEIAAIEQRIKLEAENTIVKRCSGEEAEKEYAEQVDIEEKAYIEELKSEAVENAFNQLESSRKTNKKYKMEIDKSDFTGFDFSQEAYERREAERLVNGNNQDDESIEEGKKVNEEYHKTLPSKFYTYYIITRPSRIDAILTHTTYFTKNEIDALVTSIGIKYLSKLKTKNTKGELDFNTNSLRYIIIHELVESYGFTKTYKNLDNKITIILPNPIYNNIEDFNRWTTDLPYWKVFETYINFLNTHVVKQYLLEKDPYFKQVMDKHKNKYNEFENYDKSIETLAEVIEDHPADVEKVEEIWEGLTNIPKIEDTTSKFPEIEEAAEQFNKEVEDIEKEELREYERLKELVVALLTRDYNSVGNCSMLLKINEAIVYKILADIELEGEYKRIENMGGFWIKLVKIEDNSI